MIQVWTFQKRLLEGNVAGPSIFTTLCATVKTSSKTSIPMPTLVVQNIYESPPPDIHQVLNSKDINFNSSNSSIVPRRGTHNHQTMTISIPLIVTLSESPGNDITSTQVEAGHHSYKLIDSTNSTQTVASFGKNYVLEKPEWLHEICQLQNKDENKTADFDATVSFGDGQAICVKVRNKCNYVESPPKKSSSKNKDPTPTTPTFSFLLGLFLQVDEKSLVPPAMLDPRGEC